MKDRAREWLFLNAYKTHEERVASLAASFAGSVNEGAAIAAGIIALGEWARRCSETEEPDPYADIPCHVCNAPPYAACRKGCTYAG